MDTGDLIDVLCDLGKLPLVIKGPGGERLVLVKIETKGDGPEAAVHIDLGYFSPPARRDPVGWEPNYPL